MRCLFCLFLRLFLFLSLVSLTACSTRSPRDQAREEGLARGYTEHVWQTDAFRLYSLLRSGRNDRLHVYIEGDGHAWISPRKPSDDPTPRAPVALWLALNDPTDSSVCYIARPGQYLSQEEAPCEQRYWTSARFSREVVASVNQAITRAKNEVAAKRIVLVGFSGGGAVASLAAAERDDVEFLATVGGNLDVGCWVREKRFTPLRESLDPVSVLPALSRIPQRHMLGMEDQVIPHICSRGFVESVRKRGGSAEYAEVPKYGHTDPWQKVWNYTYSLSEKR